MASFHAEANPLSTPSPSLKTVEQGFMRCYMVSFFLLYYHNIVLMDCDMLLYVYVFVMHVCISRMRSIFIQVRACLTTRWQRGRKWQIFVLNHRRCLTSTTQTSGLTGGGDLSVRVRIVIGITDKALSRSLENFS